MSDNDVVLVLAKFWTNDTAVGEMQICSPTKFCYFPQFDQHPSLRKHSIIFRNIGDFIKLARVMWITLV